MGVGGLALVAAVLLAGCAGPASVTPALGSDGAEESAVTEDSSVDVVDPPEGKDVTEWGCTDEWITEAALDGFFTITVRDDLVRSTFLPGVDGAGDVPFNSPAICVFDREIKGVGDSRDYIFDDGMPQNLAASFEASGWDGYFGYPEGFPEGNYSPTSGSDSAPAYISVSLHADGTGMMRGDLYVLSLTVPLVDKLDG